MPRDREQSWAGSEHQRRPQRPCSANGYTPCVRPPQYVIPAGTPVHVRALRGPGRRSWRAYTTKRTLEFDRFQARSGRFEVIFHDAGYAIRLPEHLCIQ